MGAFCSPVAFTQDNLASVGKDTICKEEDWKTTCEVAFDDNVFSDPLYDGMKWAYTLVDVEPVWLMGLTGKSIHVRVNDDGVSSDHPEFAGRFDVNMSCSSYESPVPTDGHGTACASLIGAAGDNDECAVGMAPEVALSSCKLLPGMGNGTLEEPWEDIFVYKIEDVDISSNSIGPIPVRVWSLSVLFLPVLTF